jgi:hypothetical protein
LIAASADKQGRGEAEGGQADRGADPEVFRDESETDDVFTRLDV